MSDKITSLPDSVILLLREVADDAVQALAESLAPANLTVAEWVCIRALYERPMSPSELAETLSVTRTRITKMADGLVAKSFVRRCADESDRRAHTLELTKQGKALVPKLTAISQRADTEFFTDMATWERVALDRALQKLALRRSKAEGSMGQ